MDFAIARDKFEELSKDAPQAQKPAPASTADDSDGSGNDAASDDSEAALSNADEEDEEEKAETSKPATAGDDKPTKSTTPRGSDAGQGLTVFVRCVLTFLAATMSCWQQPAIRHG